MSRSLVASRPVPGSGAKRFGRFVEAFAMGVNSPLSHAIPVAVAGDKATVA
ncbi:hypothetical protein FHX35_000114 [Auritidibacter ignavus]|nr:hypothetical protein [Auritidibacter ignavus]